MKSKEELPYDAALLAIFGGLALRKEPPSWKALRGVYVLFAGAALYRLLKNSDDPEAVKIQGFGI